MKTKQHIFFILIIGLALCSCKKDPVKPGKNADVYVAETITAGNGIAVATYWQNGVAIRLADSLAPSSANAIAVSGSNVYVAGVATIDGKVTAVYWKNGLITKLTNGNSGLASANTIAVIGNDIYVAGNAVNGDDITVVGFSGMGATYWKNGLVAVKLPDSSAYGLPYSNATGIAVSGSDVYISGNANEGTYAGPVYWKNGIATNLTANPDNTNEAQASCIAVNGADVYIGGITTKYNVAYWKNNSLTLLPGSIYLGSTTSMVTYSNDFYVTGSATALSNSQYVIATYWKNGNAVQLTDGMQSVISSGIVAGIISFATGIAVNGSDVYVCGNLGTDAAYWANGKLVHLSKNARTTGIAVVP